MLRLNGKVALVRGGARGISAATVRAIDAQGSSVMVEKDDGERQMLDPRQLADRHTRPDWVRTIHSSQGATCDRVMAHLESFAPTPSIPAPPMSPSAAREAVRRSTPTAARGCSMCWACGMAPRSGRSMRQWGGMAR